MAPLHVGAHSTTKNKQVKENTLLNYTMHKNAKTIHDGPNGGPLTN